MRHLLRIMMLLAALAVVTACSGNDNRVSQPGYVDHNNDIPPGGI